MERYKKDKVIGKGSFGEALLVTKIDSQKQYVLKVIKLSASSAKEKQEAMNEVKVLSALNHPHIVAYIESFMDHGNLCIIMDYANGGDLSQAITRQKGKLFEEGFLLKWFVQICLALKHVHDRKILHRDLKGQNIFLHNGMIKLGDFGISKVLLNTFECARTAIGTPYYLSPEICKEQPYGFKSDIWSLGCILYEICTLKHAFEAGNMKGLVLKITRGQYAPISSTYSSDLHLLVDSMLQKDPKKRPGINQILKLPFIATKISSLLNETIRKSEFSHTKFHGRNIVAENASHLPKPGNKPDDKPGNKPGPSFPPSSKPTNPPPHNDRPGMKPSPFIKPAARLLRPSNEVRENAQIKKEQERRMEIEAQRKIDEKRRQEIEKKRQEEEKQKRNEQFKLELAKKQEQARLLQEKIAKEKEESERNKAEAAKQIEMKKDSDEKKRIEQLRIAREKREQQRFDREQQLKEMKEKEDIAKIELEKQKDQKVKEQVVKEKPKLLQAKREDNRFGINNQLGIFQKNWVKQKANLLNNLPNIDSSVMAKRKVEAERILRANGLKSRAVNMDFASHQGSPKKRSDKNHKKGVQELRDYYLTKKGLKQSDPSSKLEPDEPPPSPPQAIPKKGANKARLSLEQLRVAAAIPENDSAHESAEERKIEREKQRNDMRDKIKRDKLLQHQKGLPTDDIQIYESPRNVRQSKHEIETGIVSPPESKEPTQSPNPSSKKNNKHPSHSPVKAPSKSPTKSPSKSPTKSPSKSPSKSPGSKPILRSRSVPFIKAPTPKKVGAAMSDVSSGSESDSVSASQSTTDDQNERDVILPQKISYIPAPAPLSDSDDEKKDQGDGPIIVNEDSVCFEDSLHDLSVELDALGPDELEVVQKDMDNMVDIMRTVLEDPCVDDHEDENVEMSSINEEEVSEEEKMHIFGITVNSDAIHKAVGQSSVQSDYYRIEALRIYLETELGDDRFIQAYRLLKDLDRNDDEDQIMNSINTILGEKANCLVILNQLLTCEDKMDNL